MQWRRIAWVVVMGLALAVQARALWVDRWGVASNPRVGPVWRVGEIAEGITAEQTFRIEAGGLRAFTLTARPVGARVAGDVVFELFDVTSDGDRPLFRGRRPGSDVATGRPHTFEFSPVGLPVPRVFKLRIGLPDARLGEGFFIDGVEADRYRDGVLVVNGQEAWGDLAFETDAERASVVGRLDDLLRPYPRWMRRPAAFGLLALGLNLLLAWVAWTALLPSRTKPHDAGVRAGSRLASRVPRLATAAIVIVLVAAAGVLGGRLQGRTVLVDLVAAFPSASKQTSMPGLHSGFASHDQRLGGVTVPCILALPTSRITWTVDVPDDARLMVTVGLRPDVWFQPGDGATFKVGVVSGGRHREVARQYLNPSAWVEDRRFVPFAIDLSRDARQRVDIVFDVDPGPGPNAVGDAALWCAPSVVRAPR